MSGLRDASLKAASVAALTTALSALACPLPDGRQPPPDTQLTLINGSTVLHLTAAQLDQLPATRLTQQQRVSSAAGTSTERSISFDGVLLREALTQVAYGGPADRAARFTQIEALATDGYRAGFSWGELFNTAVGDQALIVRGADGRPLTAEAGPLALRSLADLRPGPRHVRQLCAVIVRR